MKRTIATLAPTPVLNRGFWAVFLRPHRINNGDTRLVGQAPIWRLTGENVKRPEAGEPRNIGSVDRWGGVHLSAMSSKE